MTTVFSPFPTKLTLHKRSRFLEIEFSTGECFSLSSEYLRVFSPSADESRQIKKERKESVSILSIEPVGQYAIKLIFSDGHRTGIYSWETLYQLGVQQQKNWQDFLKESESNGS